MRRVLLVSVAVFLAAGLALSVSLSVDAQTATQYDRSVGGKVPSGDAPPERGSPFSGIAAQEAALSAPNPKVEAPNFRLTDPDPYHQVVDNATNGRFKATGWKRVPAEAQAYGGDYVVAGSSERTTDARFEVQVPKTRYYSVYARWPVGEQNATRTRFGVPTISGMKWDKVNQRTDAGFWVRIGTYKIKKGEQDLRVKADSADGGRSVADAVMIVDDVLVGPDGGTASYASPEELSGVEAVGGGTATATRSDVTTTSTRATTRPTGGDVVRVALRHRGTRYGHSTCQYQVMEDCSCHTLLVYRQFCIRLPDSPVTQWGLNYSKSRNRGWLKPGDLAFQDLTRDGRMSSHYGDHVGIYVGNNSIVHASAYWGKVVVTDLRYLPNYWGGMRPRPLR